MIWGLMSWSVVETITVIDEIMTAEVYARLLKENFDKAVKKEGLGKRYIF